MTETTTCRKCGNELPSNAPAGVCPRCLLLAGMGESSPEMASLEIAATILTDSTTPSDVANKLPTKLAEATSGNAPETGDKVRYFGEYELLTEIARGGMGVVYRARQVRLNRIVALKMILAGQFASQADVQRFHTEAEAAAQLDHPGIVPIYEVGEHDGHHFFTMGFVDGESLAARLLQGPLAPREAALLVQQIAEAVQYAHKHGVIHRDLKPANILLDRAGQPRITDFGLAKNTHHDSGLTASGQVMGTPGYMPPEQASGNANQVQEVADVYSVGAILYALLTGRPPFQADNVMDTLMQVLEREPVPPRQLNAAIPRDLEVIALKCLEKDRQRRYSSAREIADELQRFLDGRPIVARPISAPSRAWRWCRRNPMTAALVITGVTLVAILSIGGPLWAIRESHLKQVARDQTRIATDKTTVAQVATLEATKQKSIAIAQANVAREQTIKAERQARISTALRLATESRIRRNDEQVLSLLLAIEAVAVTLDAGEGVAPAAERELRDAMAQVPRPLVGHQSIIVGTLLSDDGRTLLTSSLDKKLCVWDLNNLTSFAPRLVLREAVQRPPNTFPAISLSANGRTAAAIRDDGTIQVWNLTEPDPLTTVRSLTLRRGKGQGVVLSADGLKLAAWGDAGEGSVWNLRAMDSTPILLDGSESAISRVDMSSDGTTLATTTADSIKLWGLDANSGGIVSRLTLPRPTGKLQLVLSPDGSKLVMSSQDSTVQIWDISGSKPSEKPGSWKLRALITGWRTELGDDALPLYFVQLPGSGARAGWPYLREQQRLSVGLPHTGMAVTIDLFHEDIHLERQDHLRQE